MVNEKRDLILLLIINWSSGLSISMSYWKVNLGITENDFECVKRLLRKRGLGKICSQFLETEL